MESVEVWMWLIAGLIIGGLVFVSAFSFLSNYFENQEISQAQTAFNSMKNTIDSVCIGGPDTFESRNILFPYVVNSIYVKPLSATQDCDEDIAPTITGRCLCINISKQPILCSKTKLCDTNMDPFNIDRDTNIFFLIQRALGNKKYSNLQIKVTKTDLTKVDVDVTEEYLR